MRPVLGRLFALALVAFALTGCGAPLVKVGVSSTANLNSTDKGKPLPVVVRVYQLSASQAFQNATFHQLWKKDVVTLGATLVMRNEFVMNPAFQKRFTMPRNDQAKYIAAVAIFRDPKGHDWKTMAKLPSGYFGKRMSATVTIYLKGNKIAIQD